MYTALHASNHAEWRHHIESEGHLPTVRDVHDNHVLIRDNREHILATEKMLTEIQERLGRLEAAQRGF